MATTYTHIAPARSGTTFNGMFERINLWLRVRATRRELSALSDRELDDIGLTRGDIAMIAAHSVSR